MKRPRLGSTPSIVEVMERVFASAYSGETWGPWRAVLKAGFNLPMTAEEIAFFQIVEGEGSVVVGRQMDIFANPHANLR